MALEKRRTPERRNNPESIAQELESILKKDPKILQGAVDLLGEDTKLNLFRLATRIPTADEKNPRLAELFHGSEEWRSGLVARARAKYKPGESYRVRGAFPGSGIRMELISIADNGVTLMRNEYGEEVKVSVRELELNEDFQNRV